MLTHFTNRAWLVTYEQGFSNYSRSYGVVAICNVEARAKRILLDLQEKTKKDHRLSQIEYKIQEVNLQEQKELFHFNY